MLAILRNARCVRSELKSAFRGVQIRAARATRVCFVGFVGIVAKGPCAPLSKLTRFPKNWPSQLDVRVRGEERLIRDSRTGFAELATYAGPPAKTRLQLRRLAL